MDIDTGHIDPLEELNTGTPSVLLSKGIAYINFRDFPAPKFLYAIGNVSDLTNKIMPVAF